MTDENSTFLADVIALLRDLEAAGVLPEHAERIQDIRRRAFEQLGVPYYD
jgi:hypothetical protein